MKGNSNNDLFSYDPVKMNRELEPLAELEKLIAEVGTFSYTQYYAIQSGGSFASCTIPVTTPAVSVLVSDAPANLPPFVWGCLLSGFGVALVYNTTHNNEDTKKAFMGCIVNGIVLTSVYIINLLANY
jgi:hypothetical protein